MSDPAPIPEPLSLDEVKLNLRVDGSDEDTLISSLIVAAREHVEDYTGLVLTPRTVTETASGLGRWIDLSSWPVTSVDRLEYLDSNGDEQTVDATTWRAVLAARPVRLRPIAPSWGVGSWFAAQPGRYAREVTITVTAGFATPDQVPQTIKQAMQLLIGTWYANREDEVVVPSAATVELSSGAKALLRRWRQRSL